ncbi:conserved hypothetical protein [Ricinus communis]|uniref:Uncharacterized protein n=1 Tax=Ricinus communis TaxID=3988 RepID=B9S4L2_RICCO|nr:conserved hypothetical protein [Ricinus communis]
METVSPALLHRTEFKVLFSNPYWEPFDQSWILTPKLIIYDLSALFRSEGKVQGLVEWLRSFSN